MPCSFSLSGQVQALRNVCTKRSTINMMQMQVEPVLLRSYIPYKVRPPACAQSRSPSYSPFLPNNIEQHSRYKQVTDHILYTNRKTCRQIGNYHQIHLVQKQCETRFLHHRSVSYATASSLDDSPFAVN